jgi:hypothetical protein
MPHAEAAPLATRVLIDAGVFIGVLLIEDSRHAEARPLVEQARQETLLAVESRRKTDNIRRKRNYEEIEILR